MIHLKTKYKMCMDKLIIDVYIVINVQFMKYIVTLIIVLHNIILNDTCRLASIKKNQFVKILVTKMQ